MVIALANLDVEARWAGRALPPAVAQRVSVYGALLAALAPDRGGAGGADGADVVEVWAPAAVDAARIAPIGGRQVVMRVGHPPHADLAWSDAGPIGRAANDRRFALALAHTLGVALPGSRAIGSAAELATLAGPWICKLPWTAAGRDRSRGDGPPTPEQRTRLARLLSRCGALVAEPWCDRLVDAGQCAEVDADGSVALRPAHSLLVDARGGFLGIDLAPPALAPAELAQLAATTRAAGAALATIGFVGRFAVDAFAYRDATGTRRFHPLCELNARTTFGWIAHALAASLGVRRLGFTAAPPDATVLVRDTGDGATAWVQ